MTAAATVGDLIQQTRRLLTGSARGAMNRLTSDIDNAVTNIPLDFDPGAALGKGGYICIDDEIMYVWQMLSNVAVVQRGELGTVPAAHTGGTIVEVNARFPKPMIRDALYDEIDSWPQSVYRTQGFNVDVATNSYGVDLTPLPATAYDVKQVLKKPTTTASLVRFDPFDTVWRNVGFRLERGMDPAEFASGTALFLNEAMPGGYTLRIVYAGPFDLSLFATDATNLISDCGLEPFMTDIPPYGAAWRLVAGKEVVRTALEAQGEARQTSDTPAGAILRSATALEQFRDKRLGEAGNVLVGRHGWRRTA